MAKPGYQRLELSKLPVILVFSVVLPVGAAEWRTSASVAPGLTYTDNVCLSADDEKDEWIGTVTPAGSISAKGNRANLGLSGSVELNTLSDSRLENIGCSGGGLGNRDQFSPQLNGFANATLVENWFYIDSDVVVNQNDVSPFLSGGGDSLNRTGNTNTTYNYRVSPYISRRFKDTAVLNLRYTWDDQYNTTDVVGDSTQERAEISITSVPGTAKFSWGLQGNYSETDYSDDRFGPDAQNNSELKSAQLNLGYQFTRAWQVNGFYGDEWNDFVSSRDDIDGTYWDVGLRWTPNSRTTIDVGTGDRFFGSTPRFSATHRHKRSSFNASYARTLTYDRDIRTLEESTPLDPDFPPAPDVNSGETVISNSPILDERFSLGYSFSGRRSSFGVSAFQSDQRREDNATDSRFRGVSVSMSHSISRQRSLSAGVSWDEQDPRNSEIGFFDSSETWTGSLGARQQLSQKMNLGLRYTYTNRTSDNQFNEYTENRVSLDLRVDL